MKLQLLTLLFCTSLFTFCANAETLVISNGETNSIIVASNETVVVDFIDTNSRYPICRKDGATNIVDIVKGSAFAGPCELIFQSYSTVVTFRRLQTVAVSTVVLGAGETNIVVVPTNKTLKVFATRGFGQLAVSRGTSTRILEIMDGPLASGCELTGPLTVAMIGFSSTFLGYDYRRVFSYYFTEDFVQVTANGYLKGPTGTFEVLVEKSTDLAQWLPAMVQTTTSSDSRAFYRLRIQK